MAETSSGFPTTYMGLHSLKNMVPMGDYLIQVLSGGRWIEAGRLAYDRYYREQSLALSGFAPDGPRVTIKLTQQGGGSAHLDSVFYAGLPPAAVSGVENGVKKLSAADYDVIDAFDKELILTFETSEPGGFLSVTGRIEGEIVSELPIQLPFINGLKKVENFTGFYEYTLGSESPKLLAAEYCTTSSGHPYGYTYIQVWNDALNLYLNLDFTPDNTEDGGLDYAKVVTRTPAGIKAFKVTTEELTWGSPSFVYTGRVAYQHKVYAFIIPLTELAVTAAGKVPLAFSLYGTVAAGTRESPELVFDSKNNQVLSVYQKMDMDYNIFGWLRNPDGTAIGSEITVTSDTADQVNPAAAFDGSGKYLVVWEDDLGTYVYDIRGQFIESGGTPSGTDFPISGAAYDQRFASIVFDSLNSRYCVVWQDTRNGIEDIYGLLLSSAGSVYKLDFPVCDDPAAQYSPKAAYDSKNGRFLVVWQDERNYATNSWDIYGRILDAEGNVLIPSFAICTAVQEQSSAAVAYDGTNDQYLVVWQDYRDYGTSGWNIYGQIISSGGTLLSSNFPISTAAYDQLFPAVSYDGQSNTYLVVWEDMRNGTDTDIY
ncbi:MAG: hypothetical protein AB1798_17925, partial [Spirochaetota bacterium]